MPESDLRLLDAEIWGQARVQALEVTGDVFGASHRFRHEGHNVEIRVPAVVLNEQLRPTEKWSQFARFRKGSVNDATRETNSYEIAFLEASINLPGFLTIPQAMLEVSPKRPEIAGPDLTIELDNLSVDYEGHLSSAVEYWKSVVRWITGSRAIDTPGALPGRQPAETFQLQGLYSLPDRKCFWRPTSVITFQKQTELNADFWMRIDKVLTRGYQIPVWSRFLDQAFRHLQAWDETGCILACAIACETVAKQINTYSPTQTDGSPNVHPANKRPSMAVIIGDWDKLTGLSDNIARTPEIRELVTMRNDVMHSGSSKLPLNHKKAKQLFEAADVFVRAGEGHYYSKRGQTDPRHLP